MTGKRPSDRTALALILTLLGVSAAHAEPAFPGAVGYGSAASGWKGGEIVWVTTLGEDGPGSLRACAEGDGPRVCILDVAGTVALSRPIEVGSDIYIAGQTAPGDGLQIRLGSADQTPLIVKDSQDVVIRFLKLRPGAPAVKSPAVDAITVENSERVYLDHLSLAFATDETLNIHASEGITADITVANNLLIYSLDRANHPKGRHSKGALICSFDDSAEGCGRITLWRNVFAHHRDRNPDVKASALGPVEVVSNLFYDPISQFGEYYNLMGRTRIAHVGNVTIPGPSTIDDRPPGTELHLLADHEAEIEARDNLALARCGEAQESVAIGPQARTNAARETFLSPDLPIIPAPALAETLLPMVGDRLPDGGHRDALDARAIADIRNCQGQVIDRASQVGGWPDLPPAQPRDDRDGDGLPDGWERGRPGLHPARADDPWATDPASGLSHLETWLATLAGDI